MRFRNMMLVGLCTAVAAGCYLFRRAIKPPHEATVIANFTQHRTEYEQLRSMLLSDDKLRRVADWGVETIDSPIAEVPPKGTFPADRFREYVSLLSAIHADAAARGHGPNPEARILVWGSGFGGDTRHIAICSVDKPPPNQTDSLDRFYGSPKPRHPVYIHIDSNWYIWADW